MERRLILGVIAAVTASLAWQTAAVAQRQATEADARFMRGMILHHGQALVMTALVDGRSRRDDLRLLARRIDVSQTDEIALMRAWLSARGAATGDSGHRHGDGDPMPGMATAAELDRLRAASGPGFDRLFLELMIRHHEGALAMVAGLFGSPGAGQEAEIFRFASDVDADQRGEIARMRALLAALEPVR